MLSPPAEFLVTSHMKWDRWKLWCIICFYYIVACFYAPWHALCFGGTQVPTGTCSDAQFDGLMQTKLHYTHGSISLPMFASSCSHRWELTWQLSNTCNGFLGNHLSGVVCGGRSRLTLGLWWSMRVGCKEMFGTYQNWFAVSSMPHII